MARPPTRALARARARPRPRPKSTSPNTKQVESVGEDEARPKGPKDPLAKATARLRAAKAERHKTQADDGDLNVIKNVDLAVVPTGTGTIAEKLEEPKILGKSWDEFWEWFLRTLGAVVEVLIGPEALNPPNLNNPSKPTTRASHRIRNRQTPQNMLSDQSTSMTATSSTPSASQALAIPGISTQPTTLATTSTPQVSQALITPALSNQSALVALTTHRLRSRQTLQNVPLFMITATDEARDKILFNIFKNLSYQDSLCVALTSKHLYSIHYDLQTKDGTIPFDPQNHLLYYTFANKAPNAAPLYKQINGFMRGYRFCYKHLKFVHWSQWEEKAEKGTPYGQVGTACWF